MWRKASPFPGATGGAPEAGLLALGQQRGRLLVQDTTPVHSALHEAAHFICMDSVRRESLDTDAGGEDLEESAVCYMQILLFGELLGEPEELMADMDAWGYSFRLGSTKDWFHRDAEDAIRFLVNHDLIRRVSKTRYRVCTGRLRAETR